MNERGAVDQVLAAVFGAKPPASIASLVDRDRVARRFEDFKLGPIFPLGAARPSRIALSNQDEPERWRREVLAHWGSPHLERFIDSVPSGTRRMIDTDGKDAVIYLDDLQDAALDISGPHDLPLMFLAFDAATNRVERGTRHPEPPRELVSGLLRDRLDELVARGAAGLWSLRWLREAPVGVVWVSESRWRADPEKSYAIAASVGDHPGWRACRLAAERAGYEAYPDALEARADGSWDLTLGFCRPGVGMAG